jgi:hypothetical protein
MKRLIMVFISLGFIFLFSFGQHAKAQDVKRNENVQVGINLVYTATSGSRIYSHVNLTNSTDSTQFITVTTAISENRIIGSILANYVDSNFGNHITETVSGASASWLVELAPHGRTRLVVGAIAGLVTETVRVESFYKFILSGAYVFSGTQPLQIEPSAGNVLTSISPSTVSAGQEFCVFGQITGGGFVFRLPDGYFDVPPVDATETMACGRIENIDGGLYQVYMSNKFGVTSNPMNLTVVNRSWMPMARK